MSLESIFLGIDPDEEQRRQDELDAALREQNQLDREKYGEKWYAQADAHVTAGAINVSKEIDDAFGEGWQDGINGIRNTAGAIIGTPFKLVPANAYVLGAIALFFWAGGAKFLKFK